MEIESRRDDRNIPRIDGGSFAPPGLAHLLPTLPRLNRGLFPAASPRLPKNRRTVGSYRDFDHFLRDPSWYGFVVHFQTVKIPLDG